VLVYTPLWCAWVLAVFTVLEDSDDPPMMSGVDDENVENGGWNRGIVPKIQSIPNVRWKDWVDLLRGNLGFFLPVTALICGGVEREKRVLAFGVVGLVYTTVLLLWNERRGGDGEKNLF